MAHEDLGRLPSLKFERTLWVCEITGGPFKYSATKPGKTHLGLEVAHRDLKISPTEFDEVAAELGRSLDVAKVPAREKGMARPKERRRNMFSTRTAPSSGIRLKKKGRPSPQPKAAAPRRPKNLKSRITRESRSPTIFAWFPTSRSPATRGVELQ
jgi:hypothetical protein